MRIVWMTAAAALLVCGIARAEAPARDDGSAAVGVGIICNTPEQAKRFIALQLKGRKPRAAMRMVNAEAKDARACGVAAVAFIRDRTIDTEAMRDRLVQVVRINVVAGYDGHGWQRVSNMTQYAVIEAEGGISI